MGSEARRSPSAPGGALDPLTLGLMIADRKLSGQVVGCLAERPMRVVLEMPELGSATEELIAAEVRRSGPDVVILEVAAAGRRWPALIRLVKDCPTLPAVITIHAAADPDALMGAMRVGADDCLYLPLDEGALLGAVERVAAERAQTEEQRLTAKTIGFLSVMGGCGGTMLACHFAGELRRLTGQNLLLADFDVVSGMVGFWTRTSHGYSIRDAVRGLHRMDLSLWRGLVSSPQPQLDVLSAPPDIMSGEACTPEQLLKVLRFARGHYPRVIADLGAGLTQSALRLLGELNALFVVSTAEVAALYQARRTLAKLVSVGLGQEQVRLVLNRAHKRQQVRPGDAEKALGWQIEAVLPDDPESVARAQEQGRLLSPKSELGKSIAELVARTIGPPGEEKTSFWAPVFRVLQPRGT